MRIVHILSDGTKLDDISNHIVKEKDVEDFYSIVKSIEHIQEVEK